MVNQSVVNYTNLVKWTLIVKNNGPNEATRVVVMDKLPEGLTALNGAAFGYCESLDNVMIPNGVTSIGYMAFSGCASLKSIYIPATVTRVEN